MAASRKRHEMANELASERAASYNSSLTPASGHLDNWTRKMGCKEAGARPWRVRLRPTLVAHSIIIAKSPYKRQMCRPEGGPE